MEPVPGYESDEPPVVGEHFSEDISRAVARTANGQVKGNGENTHIDLGELGEHSTDDVRFRDSAKQGFVTAYVRSREFTEEHQVITTIAISSVAIGVVLGGIRAFKHHKK